MVRSCGGGVAVQRSERSFALSSRLWLAASLSPRTRSRSDAHRLRSDTCGKRMTGGHGTRHGTQRTTMEGKGIQGEE